MALWDNYDDVDFQVVANAAGQYSVWPSTRPCPPGWSDAGFAGPRQACLDEIDEIDGIDGIDRRGQGRPGAAERPPVAAAGTGPRPAPEEGRSALYGPHRAVPDVPVTELIRARELPADLVAAVCGEQRLTRGELFDTAAGWARVLTEEGCGREVPVGLLLPRGLDALTAIFAVLEAGGGYVPLSCDDPPARTEAVLRDCGARTVVTTDELAATLGPRAGRVLTLSELRARAAGSTARPRPAAGDDLAYVFYTSGTTGRPKGVEGTHRQLVNYALWCGPAFEHRPGEVTFLSASLFFLGSLTTIFTPLLEGRPIVVAPDGVTTDELLELTRGSAGGLLKITPTHLRMMTARGVPQDGPARQLMVGSEPLTFTPEIRAWLGGDRSRVMVNHYGLTETHGCFCHWLTGDEETGGRIPVGTPIDNVEAYLVDRDGELVGIGEVGELLVGGPSLGRGYRHRPALTAERWIPHPWGADGARLLRTGDLARLGADGVVTVLGRADRQVKIRGHRVEPAAVEEALRGLPGVGEALVLPRSADGTTALDAFVLRAAGAGAGPDPVALREALETAFPPQWIPARMAVLDEFPVNANGKVDIAALPVPRPPVPVTAAGGPAERWSRLDRIVAEAFCDVLEVDDIGLADGFYDLGGDSLTSVRVAALVGRALGRDVPAPSADAATVRGYARRIGPAGAAAPAAPAKRGS
ncbi:amino acid adenylation domain-containing protein [Kitasatospora indigofera]|uniref:amino acid adenylation domain-containing protein n=1 Tax=Kitasatospora indigofera TaxID=67307 RepID=UPI003633C819